MNNGLSFSQNTNASDELKRYFSDEHCGINTQSENGSVCGDELFHRHTFKNNPVTHISGYIQQIPNRSADGKEIPEKIVWSCRQNDIFWGLINENNQYIPKIEEDNLSVDSIPINVEYYTYSKGLDYDVDKEQITPEKAIYNLLKDYIKNKDWNFIHFIQDSISEILLESKQCAPIGRPIEIQKQDKDIMNELDELTKKTEEENVPDMVNHPPHYDFSIEPIDAIESWNLPFHLGTSVKYIARWDRKNDPLENIQKAIWYLKRFEQLLLKTK